MKLWILAGAIAVQSCTPVFAQDEASRGQPHPASKVSKKRAEKKLETKDKKEKPVQDEDKISTSETDKAEFEKKPNEPSMLDNAVEFGSEQSQKVGRTLGAARANRQDTTWTIAGNYSVFEMWTVQKYGLTLGYNKSESDTFEFEYMRGSVGFGWLGIDLGSFSEERYGLNWRSFGNRNAFSFVSGIYYNILDMHLGSDALASVAGTAHAKVDLLKIHTMGIHWGIGSRWQTKGGFVWGADWIAINLPIWIVKQEHPFIDATSNPELRDEAKDAMRLFRRIPEFAALKIQLGFSF